MYQLQESSHWHWWEHMLEMRICTFAYGIKQNNCLLKPRRWVSVQQPHINHLPIGSQEHLPVGNSV